MKSKIIFDVCIAAVLVGGFVACKNVWSFGELKDYQPGKIVKISYESTYGTPPESVSFINKAVRNTDLLPKMSAVDATGTDLVFDGWYDGDTKQTADDSEIVDSKTFVARWKIKNGFNGNISYDQNTQIAPVFTQQIFWSNEGGTYNTSAPRIPALLALPGKVLLAFADRRYEGSGDLPGLIEVWVKRSTDNGTTWDGGKRITKELKSADDGMGDVAVAYDKIRDTVVAIVCADAGLYTGISTKWVKTYMIRSRDKGVTWDAPVDITHFLYGPNCEDPKRKKMYAAFAGSGNAIQMANGRLIYGFSFRTTEAPDGKLRGQCVNYAVYSDDGGETWQVSKNSPTDNFTDNIPATTQGNYNTKYKGYGDEPKIVELPDGRLMMTIRPGGIAEFRYQRAISYSYDGGETWTKAEQNKYLPSSASNGDTVVYSSVASGWDKDRILCAFDIQPYRIDFANSVGFSRYAGDFYVPTGNVGTGGPGWPAFFISYDGGETWKGRVWTTGNHGYSSFTILDDGSIGVLAEHGGNWGGGSLTFFRTNIEWITNGADSPKKAP